MRYLAIKLRAIGDTVIWTSALNSLRKARPTAEIHVLTYASNLPVLLENPAIDRVHTLKSHSRFELIRRLYQMKGEKYDYLLGFHATTSLCRWAWVAGARQMVLHHHSWPYTPQGSIPIEGARQLEDAITRDRRVLQALQFETPRAPTVIAVSPSEAQNAEAQLRNGIFKVGGLLTKPRYLFLPGASHHLRRYPKDLWWPLVLKVRDQAEYQPVVICDSALSREWGLRELCEQERVPLFDQSGLREFICLVSRGQKALANDSGPGHIAVALRLETSFVFGPGCVGDWHPYDKSQSRVYRVPVDCRLEGPRDREEFQFCVVDQCEHHRCMRGINLA